MAILPCGELETACPQAVGARDKSLRSRGRFPLTATGAGNYTSWLSCFGSSACSCPLNNRTGTPYAARDGMLSPRAEAQLALMHTEVQRYGHSIVGCDQLLVFVSATDPIHAQFGHIFTLAEQEGWSVEFRPDGTVRFALLPRAGQLVEWDGSNSAPHSSVERSASAGSSGN
jgi:hypothetical protein